MIENVTVVIFFSLLMDMTYLRHILHMSNLISRIMSMQNSTTGLATAGKILSVSPVIELLIFSLYSLIYKGFKRPLSDEDLWTLSDRNSSSYIVPKFLEAWSKEEEKVAALK